MFYARLIFICSKLIGFASGLGDLIRFAQNTFSYFFLSFFPFALLSILFLSASSHLEI